MEFYIKQGASQPILVMGVNRDNYFSYELFQKAFENSTITFSMMNVETGVYKIAKKLAGLILKPQYITEIIPYDTYYIYYKFSPRDTNQPGRYKAEFKIDFLDTDPSYMTGTFIGPVQDDLYINIKQSLFNETNINNKPNINDGVFTDTFTNVFN